MREVFQTYKYHIIISTFILFIILLILPFSTRINVEKDRFYYEKSEVALYILKFSELPSNFITKSEATTLYTAYYDAMEDGFNIGGDNFRYDGIITSYTTNPSLVECDIYINREYLIVIHDRGDDRLVFTIDGSEVYFTDDHYSSFRKITLSQIQSLSNTWWILFIIYDGLCIALYTISFKKKWIYKDDFKNLINKILVFLLGFIALLKSVFKVIFNKITYKKDD